MYIWQHCLLFSKIRSGTRSDGRGKPDLIKVRTPASIYLLFVTYCCLYSCQSSIMFIVCDDLKDQRTPLWQSGSDQEYDTLRWTRVRGISLEILKNPLTTEQYLQVQLCLCYKYQYYLVTTVLTGVRCAAHFKPISQTITRQMSVGSILFQFRAATATAIHNHSHYFFSPTNLERI